MLRTEQSCHVLPFSHSDCQKCAMSSSTENEREPLMRGLGCIGLNDWFKPYGNIICFRLYS